MNPEASGNVLVTYKEDKDTVSAALNKMADEGLYEGI